MASSSSNPLFIFLTIIIFFFYCSEATRSFPAHKPTFLQAPQFHCSSSTSSNNNAEEDIHIAMTLDSKYFRGTVAAIFSLLNHSSCPDQLLFHFIVDDDTIDTSSRSSSAHLLLSIFPSLRFSVHPFLHHSRSLSPLISSSVRKALENPLNYARNYLPDLLPPSITKVLYLDSDVVVVDDIANLWNNATSTTSSSVIAAPEYCHVDFRRYFNKNFWDKGGMEVFKNRRSASPCYFNTGVMVIRLDRWREGGYTRRIERWMELQREERMYELGSLPPLLLAFAGDVEAVDHRWNQHGLGGDNATGKCREVHPGPVSLLHWSGRGKPWDRLDEGRPCPVDLLWKPYDLYIRGSSLLSPHSSYR